MQTRWTCNLLRLFRYCEVLDMYNRVCTTHEPLQLYRLPVSYARREIQAILRLGRASFFSIVELIKESNVFASTEGKMKRASVEVHLLVLLRFLGSNGNAGSLPELAAFFHIGSGTAHVYITRCLQAILQLKDSVLRWPDEEERTQIAQRHESAAVFKNCVGVIDGTLFPLEYKPTLNGCDYFSRKGCYAVSSQIVCDDQARIRHIVVGWPGSTHDNRMWRNSVLYLRHSEYFDRRQYLLGDSAYSCSPILISSFKKRANCSLPRDKEYFNTLLGRLRVKSEHCIGLLKARFQQLKQIRTTLRKKFDMRRIIRVVLAAAILHKLFIGDPVPATWIDVDNDAKMNNAEDEDAPIEWDGDGEERRNQLFAFVLEGIQY